MNFSTPFSTNAVSMCKSIDLCHINRIEYSTRYLIKFEDRTSKDDERILTKDLECLIVSVLHDKMTHCHYKEQINSFELEIKPKEVFEVDLLSQGRAALEKANKELGILCMIFQIIF